MEEYSRKIQTLAKMENLAISYTRQGQTEATAVGEFMQEILESADQFETTEDTLDNLEGSLEELVGWAQEAHRAVLEIRRKEKSK